MCDCKSEGEEFYFSFAGYDRTGLRCEVCGELWDWMPQYNNDPHLPEERFPIKK